MFTEKLKALRLQRGLNKKQMSELLLMKYTTYNNYETGTREPNSDFLKTISKEFNVTIDYLLDNTDDILSIPSTLEYKKSSAPTKAETEELTKQMFDILYKMLIENGLIKEGEDISDNQLVALKIIGSIIANYF